MTCPWCGVLAWLARMAYAAGPTHQQARRSTDEAVQHFGAFLAGGATSFDAPTLQTWSSSPRRR